MIVLDFVLAQVLYSVLNRYWHGTALEKLAVSRGSTEHLEIHLIVHCHNQPRLLWRGISV